MKQYPKIQSIYKRDMQGNRKLIEGLYSLPEFEYLKDNLWIFTEKIDGTNIRVIYDSNPLCDMIEVKGRTDKAEIPTFLQTKLNDIFNKEMGDKLTKIFGETLVCLYGEGYGARIQKGGGNYIKDGTDFILFDIRIGDWWLKRVDVEKIAKQLNLRIVPIVGLGTLKDARKLIKEGVKSSFGDFLAEGLVLKPEINLLSRNRQRIITKIKHKDF